MPKNLLVANWNYQLKSKKSHPGTKLKTLVSFKQNKNKF